MDAMLHPSFRDWVLSHYQSLCFQESRDDMFGQVTIHLGVPREPVTCQDTALCSLKEQVTKTRWILFEILTWDKSPRSDTYEELHGYQSCPCQSVLHTGLWLVNTDSILTSDWSRQSRDLYTDLWLVTTFILNHTCLVRCGTYAKIFLVDLF